MASKIKFRREALDKLYSTKANNGLLRVLRVYSWPLLYGSTLAAFLFLAWSIFGNIPYWVKGEGLLMSKGSTIHGAVLNEEAILMSYTVPLGAKVLKGQEIAITSKPDLQTQVHSLKNHLKNLRSLYENTREEYLKALKAQKEKLEAQNKLLRLDIMREEVFQITVKEFLDGKQKLLRKNLISRDAFQAQEQNYLSSLRQADSLRNEIYRNEMSYVSMIDDWKDRLRLIEIQCLTAENDYVHAEKRLKDICSVKSPIEGCVLGFHKNIGDRVPSGDPIASVTECHQGLEAVAYIPVQEAKRIVVGQKALISPTIYQKEEYGSIKGKVLEVTPYPVTPQEVKARFQNDVLVKSFSEKGAFLKVKIELKEDKKTKSGFQWSSSKGPLNELSAGTWLEAQVLVEERRPLSLLVPALKVLLGVS